MGAKRTRVPRSTAGQTPPARRPDGGRLGPDGLRARHRAFVLEYLKDHNGAQAYLRAFGGKAKPSSAAVLAARLMGNEWVAAAIKAEEEKLCERISLKADRALLEVARVAFSDVRGLFTEAGGLKPPHEWPADLAPAVSAVEVTSRRVAGTDLEYIVTKVKLWDKNAALTNALKHLGLLKDRLELGAEGSLAKVLQLAAQGLSKQEG